ncbi:unnamed protein product [Brachionus calyciflorus]|uniref:Uncharacterized protein n=1 Tax=Brachionus calyciflorus TaxID=104777 RepID=A0A813P6Y3_9BILA|nr:unnamed protein product [Brachionus calyciflorus]
MQVETIVGSPPTVQSPKKKERNLLSASLQNEQNYQAPLYTEKTIYRSQKFDEDKPKNFDEVSRCSSVGPNARPSSHLKSTRRNKQNNSLDWSNLGEKIEDWFEEAKTPDQKVVYRFLRDLKEEDGDRASVASSMDSSVSDKAQSLEDILDHLKKYRTKFNRKSRLVESRSAALPAIRSKENNSLLSHSQENLKGSFESSTWRVMRHLKSADIRNKYPLPKANPDYHFRNATIFQTAGRPPKSTFLLHPDWV